MRPRRRFRLGVMRVCSGPGCLRAVKDGVRFCDDCKPTTSPVESDGIRDHGRYDAELHAVASSPRWQRVRLQVIKRDPICKRCDLRISTIGDHIVPAEIAVAQVRATGRFPDRYAGYFLMSNLQGLCRPCHGLKTLEDKTHIGPWRDVLAHDATIPKRVYSF